MPLYRHRTRDVEFTDAGYYQRYWLGSPIGAKQYGYTGRIARDDCQDWTDPKPYRPHSLLLYHTKADPYILNGKDTGNVFEPEYVDFNPESRCNPAFCPGPPAISWTYWRTKALANINPNTPVVDVPLFLFEFKDFPRMLKHAGDVLAGNFKPSTFSDAVLAYNFGWAPLLNDLHGLLNMQESIERRMEYFTAGHKGVRVKRQLGKHESSDPLSNFTAVGDGPEHTRTFEVSEKHWYTARLKIASDYGFSNESLKRLATRQVLGLNLSAATIWNMVPWSWLIDYFVNAGDVMNANRGGIPFRVTDMCNMATIKSVDKLGGTVSNPYNMSFSGGNLYSTAKLRSYSPLPTADFAFKPWLTRRQKINMLALATSKALQAIDL